MTATQTMPMLVEAIRLHKLWLGGDSSGKRMSLSGANFSDADFIGANFSGANFSDADFIGANFSGADLSGADFRRADLSGANFSDANLSGASFSDANLSDANFRGANFSGANFSDANLRGANFSDFDSIPVIPNIDAAILAAIETPGNSLNMDSWHTCQTTHCRAGWAITLAGEAGKKLEERYGSSTAGALIYAKSRPDKLIPDFMDSNEGCMADLRECAGLT